MIKAWEIAEIERELQKRNQEAEQKENETQTELDYYKQEATKIPNLCPQKPCYIELSSENRDMEFVMNIARKHCPTICPKWKGDGK